LDLPRGEFAWAETTPKAALPEVLSMTVPMAAFSRSTRGATAVISTFCVIAPNSRLKSSRTAWFTASAMPVRVTCAFHIIGSGADCRSRLDGDDAPLNDQSTHFCIQ